ncbi:MAG TPA: hypothetical protein VEH29_09970 [Acidimicrobiales bacterium]|nr:hypothetical protein [Acidimicrobiales bacterium]
MATADSRHEDWSAILAARKELGDEYDRAFVERVVESVSAEVDERVDARLAEMAPRRAAPRRRGATSLVVYSLALGIPITDLAGDKAHLAGIAVAWTGIVLVNVANAWRPRERVPYPARQRTIRADWPRTRDSRTP